MKGFIVSTPLKDEALTQKNLVKEVLASFEAMMC